MSRRFKNTVGKKRSINKKKRNRWISIESELQDVEQKRTICFLLGGGDLTLNYVCMLDDSSYRILVAEGAILHAGNPKVSYRLMIDNIISDLKSGKIRSYKRYNAKEFYEKYSKEFLSNENLQQLEASAIESATTELPNLSQSEELTTKDEVQESSTVDLQDQEFYFVPDEETSYVIEEIKRSNASNGITMQNIESVQNTTNILGNPMIHDTNLRGFKLLETPSNEKNNIVFTVGALTAAVPLVAAIAAAVKFKCWSCNRKSKGHSSSKEETPSSYLLSAITLESGANSIS